MHLNAKTAGKSIRIKCEKYCLPKVFFGNQTKGPGTPQVFWRQNFLLSIISPVQIH